MESMVTRQSMGDVDAFDTYRKAWQEFINNHRIFPTVNPAIAASWHRCWPRLNPFQPVQLNLLSTDHLLAAQVASFDLISVARPVMEDIFQFIEFSNTAIALTNGTGYVLTVLGDSEMVDLAGQHGYTTGALVGEPHFGTNAFSTSVVERLPVRVDGPEHFLQQLHELSEVASPIFDITGRPLGALGMVNRFGEQHPHSLGLVIAGARAIEAQRQADLLLGEQNRQLASLNAILSSISDGILVWNAEGILMHINAAATKIIDMPSKVLVGRPMHEFIQFPTLIQQAIDKKETLTNVEAKLLVGDRPVNCVLNLRFVHTGQELQSTIITMKQEKEVRHLVHQQLGSQALFTMEDITGESVEIRRVVRLATTAAQARASILLRGESGTGKNIRASAIHNASQRREGPFLIFACSTVPAELLVSELLGYEEGLARKRPGGRPSKFELAQGGTIFFQDVDALPLEAQAILLNVVDLGIFQRLGSDRTIPADVRILASSSADLEKLIAQGNFRADLFYRLSSFEITLPALRERTRDIPLLAERILRRLSRQLNRPLRLADETIEFLKRYPWPGNIHELEAVLGRAAVHAGTSQIIGPMHLPESVSRPASFTKLSREAASLHSLHEVERQALLQAARACRGNVTQMAHVLQIGRTTVWRKLKEFAINPDDFRTTSLNNNHP
jgi:transcriptional regulator of acetoin/glycerol metabolism